MSKIFNVRLPNAVSGTYDPNQFNQLVRSLEQIVLQLNSSYTSQTTGDTQTTLDWFNGDFGPSSLGTLDYQQRMFAYGAFLDFNVQTASVIDTPTAITWGTTAQSKFVSVGSPTSRIVFTKPGKYYIHFTAQLNSASANAKTFWFWPRINGADITGSTMRVTVHDNDEAKTIARAAIFEVNSGDYLEAYFAVDDLDTSLETYAAETFCPAVPSVTLMVLGMDYG